MRTKPSSSSCLIGRMAFGYLRFMLYFLKKAIEGCLIWISSFFISRSYNKLYISSENEGPVPMKKKQHGFSQVPRDKLKGQTLQTPPGPTVEVGIKLSGWKPQLINSAGFFRWFCLQASRLEIQLWCESLPFLLYVVILSQTRWNQDQTYVENISVPQKIFFSNVNFE